MRKLILLLVCLILSSFAVQAQVTCDDPDEQPDLDDTIDTMSEVTYGLTPKTDECISAKDGYRLDPSRWVREYYCDGDPEQRKSKDLKNQKDKEEQSEWNEKPSKSNDLKEKDIDGVKHVEIPQYDPEDIYGESKNTRFIRLEQKRKK